MATVLTDAERQALNDAAAIFEKFTTKGSSWLVTMAFYKANEKPSQGSFCYFDSSGEQHSFLQGETWADKVQCALEIEDGVEKDEELIRQREIKRLRDQLEDLEKAA
jgi:hypothetical protein